MGFYSLGPGAYHRSPMHMGNSVFTPSAIFRMSVPAKPCCLLRPHFNWSAKKKMADLRREEGGTVVVQIHRSKVPYLYTLSIPLFSGYLPMIQCSICCIPCSDVVRFHGVRVGKLSEFRVFRNLDSWRRLSLCLDTVLSFISYYFSYMFSTPVRDLKSGKFWQKCLV